MQANPYNFLQWEKYIPNIREVIAEMDRTPIIAVGITPYTRIIPAFFLKNFSIYTIKKSSDVDVMRNYTQVHALEDRYPKLVNRIHGTGYLIGNFAFQNFLQTRRKPFKLMFYTITEKIVRDLNAQGIEWIGNNPETFKEVMFKGSFRELVKQRGLPILPSLTYSRADFLAQTFEVLFAQFKGSFVVQRADKEVGGNEGTFFVHTAADFAHCVEVLNADESFNEVIATAFIKGYSTSMLGCVLPQGTLSGPLQIQLIDVPEALHGVPANGIFLGNDLGFNEWGEHIEKQAQEVVESIGAYLREQGYKGIFGIDFLYDKERDQIYPNECNPRFTGSLVLYSLMLLEAGLPPFEFFHLLAHLDIHAEFNFDEVNQVIKKRLPYAHIAISPKDIRKMHLPLLAGVYEYNVDTNDLSYEGPGVSLADIKNERQFMLIDTVPTPESPIEQNVPRLFKFIFPRSIAKSSYEIDEQAGFLLERFSKTLLAANEMSTEKEVPAAESDK